MRRNTKALIRTVILVAALAGGSALPAAARGVDRPGPCHRPREAGETVQHHSKRLIRCATDRWAVPGGSDKAICIARRESGLDPSAVSSGGDFLGLFQHMASAWPERYETWTNPPWELSTSALNGRTNTVVSIRMVNALGWSPWAGPGC